MQMYDPTFMGQPGSSVETAWAGALGLLGAVQCTPLCHGLKL